MSKKCKRRANEGGIYEDHKSGCEAATRIRGDRPCDLASAETPPPTYKRLKSCGSCYDIVGAVGTTEGRLLGEVRKDDCTDIIHAKVTPLLDAAQQAADIEHQKLVRDTLKATLRAHIDADARAVGERERAKNLAAEAARFKTETVTIRPNPDALKAALKNFGDAVRARQPVKGPDADTFTIPFAKPDAYTPEPPTGATITTPSGRTYTKTETGWTSVRKTGGPPPTTTSAYEPPPTHYATPGGIDPWQVWDAFDLDPWEANLVKYILRAGKKPGEDRLKDLKKARNYLGYLIEREEKK